MSGDFWYIFFLAVVLKLPILGMCAIIWWAVRSTPDPEIASDEDGGLWRRDGASPRNRGPHGHGPVALPDCPPGGRARTAAQARRRAAAQAD